MSSSKPERRERKQTGTHKRKSKVERGKAKQTEEKHAANQIVETDSAEHILEEQGRNIMVKIQDAPHHKIREIMQAPREQKPAPCLARGIPKLLLPLGQLATEVQKRKRREKQRKQSSQYCVGRSKAMSDALKK